jgi:hypothetical protein
MEARMVLAAVQLLVEICKCRETFWRLCVVNSPRWELRLHVQRVSCIYRLHLTRLPSVDGEYCNIWWLLLLHIQKTELPNAEIFYWKLLYGSVILLFTGNCGVTLHNCCTLHLRDALQSLQLNGQAVNVEQFCRHLVYSFTDGRLYDGMLWESLDW